MRRIGIEPFNDQRNNTRARVSHDRRRGAVLVESAIISSLLFLIVMGMADLAIGVLHFNSLSESARRLGRFVATSGELATPEREMLGPDSYIGTAADDSRIAEELRRTLTVPDLEHVSITVNWVENSNRVGDRVQVLLTYPYQSIVPSIIGESSFNLTVESLVSIRH